MTTENLQPSLDEWAVLELFGPMHSPTHPLTAPAQKLKIENWQLKIGNFSPANEATTEPPVSLPAAAIAWVFVQALAAWSWLVWRCTSISICAWCQQVMRWPWLPWAVLKYTGYHRTHGICRECGEQFAGEFKMNNSK